jgi:hypothetical protein
MSLWLLRLLRHVDLCLCKWSDGGKDGLFGVDKAEAPSEHAQGHDCGDGVVHHLAFTNGCGVGLDTCSHGSIEMFNVNAVSVSDDDGKHREDSFASVCGFCSGDKLNEQVLCQ